jgi:hypothetical protein
LNISANVLSSSAFAIVPASTVQESTTERTIKMGAHPDSNLHPVATGPAKAIVDAHQAEQPLKLYSGWL